MKISKIKKGGEYINMSNFMNKNHGYFIFSFFFLLTVSVIVLAVIFPFRPRFYM